MTNFNATGNALRRLSAVILVTAATVLCLGSYSLAEDSQIQFDIPSQDMGSALIEYADATDLSLIYDLGELGSIKSNSVSGQHFPLEALGIMLGDKGLKFEKTGEETIAISIDNKPSAKMEEKFEETGLAVKLPKMIVKKEEKVSKDAFEFEEITVTGTRVRGAETVGASVVDIDRNDISLSGGTTVDRMIKELPQVFDLGITESSRGTSGGSSNIVWGNSINLRGIGPYSTLTLLDGHRVTSSTLAVNPSVIPSLGVERIEIITDGASAIYGSDAVAGVVNIIQRRSLDGVETSLRYGSGAQFSESNVGIAVGKIWGSGQAMFAYEHAYRSNLNGLDRIFFTDDHRQFGGTDRRTTRSSPGTIRAGGTTFAIPHGGVTQETADALVPGTTNLMDTLVGQDLLPRQEYDSANATFTQAVNNNIEVFADGFYSKRKFERFYAFATATLNVPGTNAFSVQPPGTTEGSYLIDYNFMNDLPRELQTGWSKNWEITPGIRIGLARKLQLEALYTYGRSDEYTQVVGILDGMGMDQLLSSSDPEAAFDPYGLGRTSASTLEQMAGLMFVAPTKNIFQGYEISVNGPLFDIPGGSARFAAGYEGQEYDLTAGDALGPAGVMANLNNYTRRVDSGFLEVFFPVVGSKNNIIGINRLEFTVALRHDSYDDVGSTTNPKIGFNYSPTQSLLFHGSYGTSFRAPLLREYYTKPSRITAQMYQNPVGGPPLQGYTLNGGNSALEPEVATNWSVGVDFIPTENTGIGLTFFSVDYDKQIVRYLSDLSILTYEDEFAGTGVILHGTEARDLVLELLSEGIELAGSFPGGDPNNVDLFVDGRPQNLGISLTRGIDFNLTHTWETDSAGSFLFNLTGTYFTKFEVARTPIGEKVDKVNTIFNPLRLKWRGSVLWGYRAVESQLAVNFVNGYDNTAATPTQSVDAYYPVDILVRFKGDNIDWLGPFGNGLSFTLEARNVFDEDPPYVNITMNRNGGGGFDPTASNPIGRLIAVTLRKNF